MQWDVWYDLAVLEMSELSDPAKGKLIEAEQDQTLPATDAEDESAATPEQSA